MPLNRAAVVKYAEEHWFTPCDDHILLSYIKGQVNVETERNRLKAQGKLPGSGWKAVIIPDIDNQNRLVDGKERGCFIRSNPLGEEIIAPAKPSELQGKFDIVPFYRMPGEHDGLVDCAHYVSRCLTAGGVKINQPGVGELVHEIRKRPDTRTLGLEVKLAQGQRIMSTGIMKNGDLIAYVHEDPKTHKRGYSHSALYMGFDAKHKVHRMTCHTVARFREFFQNDSWNITDEPDWRFTLVHFSDEPHPTLPKPIRMEVTVSGTTETYEFRSNGIVVRSRAALPHLAFGSRPDDNGYWFSRGLGVFVFWPKSGQVARFGFTSVNDIHGAQATVDGHNATFRELSN
ncbi:hypothetical protein [Schlesneria paludicola]|uniref:hypothetical protein n=1 Tax=Schlesneria paludicola TaxID=360056 RepID=UPI00029A718F|nr:hypothetical protein [Schlesneria paludicola]